MLSYIWNRKCTHFSRKLQVYANFAGQLSAAILSSITTYRLGVSLPYMERITRASVVFNFRIIFQQIFENLCMTGLCRVTSCSDPFLVSWINHFQEFYLLKQVLNSIKFLRKYCIVDCSLITLTIFEKKCLKSFYHQFFQLYRSCGVHNNDVYSFA